MQNKKVILAVILVAGAIFSLIYGITAPPASKGRRASSQQGPALQGNAANLNVSTSPTNRLAVRTRFKSWRRRPFAPVGTPGGSGPTTLVLSGIFAKGNAYKAMVGDTIVMKGDKIGSNTVVDIQKDKVILNDGTKDFELKLEK